ncbi:MAG: hypothetical protein ACYTGG_08080 [Planctomycetota bacterium]|jgi:hypothetical protein
MREASRQPGQHRRRGLRVGLLALKLVGLAGVLGGLGAISAMWRFGPRPDTVAGWLTLIGAMRSIFFPCVFGGLMVTIASGAGLSLLRRRDLARQRWVRVKIVALAALLPLLHFTARGRVLRFYEAVEARRLDDAAALWDDVGHAFVIALGTLLLVAAFARVKPRLGGGRST